jgi:hypothetical protein
MAYTQLTSRPQNRTDFFQLIKAKIGIPYQTVEVTNEQMLICSWQAIDYYTQYMFDGSYDGLLTFQSTQGVYDYNLEVTGVNQDIYAIHEIIDSSMYSGLFPYGPTQSDIDFLVSIGRVMGRENSITDAKVAFQNIEMFRSMFVTKPSWQWNWNTYTIHFDTDPLGKAYYLLCNILVDYDGNSTGRLWTNRWLIEYMTALVMIQFGTNLAKYSNLNLPGGGQINFDYYITTGKEEKTRLEAEAKDLGNLSYRNPIIMA